MESGNQLIVTPDNRVEIRPFAIPAPGLNQVLIKTTRTLIIAGTELGDQEQTRTVDYAPGYSNVGHIVATGSAVKSYSTGNRVLSLAPHASHVICSTRPEDFRHVPPEITDAVATFGVLGSVAMHGVRKAHIELGEHVLITGMGLVGQLALRLAAQICSENLIAADLQDRRLERARLGGATRTINPTINDLNSQIACMTARRGVDIVIKASGYPDVLPAAIQACRVGGRIVLLGSIWHRRVSIDFMDFHLKELLLIGRHQPKCPVEPTSTFPWTQ